MNSESKLISTTRFVKKLFLLAITLLVLYFVYGWTVEYFKENFSETQIPIFTNNSVFLYQNKLFGELELPNIEPTIAIEDGSKAYISIKGDFKKFSEAVFVRQIGKKEETFLTVSQASQTAKDFGFDGAYQRLNTDTLIWKEDSNRTLIFNKQTQSWEYNRFNNNTSKENIEYINASDLTDLDPEEISSKISGLVNSMSFEFKDYNFENIDVFTVNQSNDVSFGYKISKSNDSKFLFFSLFQSIQSPAVNENSKLLSDYFDGQSYSNYGRIVWSNPFVSNFYAVVQSDNLTIDGVTKISFKPIVIEEETGIYNVVSAEEAYERLQNGEGYLRNILVGQSDVLNEQESYRVDEFIIDAEQIELAYFVKDTLDGYTYPIYIFKGMAILGDGKTGEFIFYVDALE